MENEIIDFNNETSNPSFTISPGAKAYLTETARWGKFLAIVGFILTGLLVILGLFMGTIFDSMGQQNPLGGWIGLFYAAFGLLYFFPSLYLFKYATKLKNAFATRNNEALTSAFENEKSMFKFMGILMIIMLGLYALIFIGGFLFAAFDNF